MMTRWSFASEARSTTSIPSSNGVPSRLVILHPYRANPLCSSTRVVAFDPGARKPLGEAADPLEDGRSPYEASPRFDQLVALGRRSLEQAWCSSGSDVFHALSYVSITTSTLGLPSCRASHLAVAVSMPLRPVAGPAGPCVSRVPSEVPGTTSASKGCGGVGTLSRFGNGYLRRPPRARRHASSHRRSSPAPSEGGCCSVS